MLYFKNDLQIHFEEFKWFRELALKATIFFTKVFQDGKTIKMKPANNIKQYLSFKSSGFFNSKREIRNLERL